MPLPQFQGNECIQYIPCEGFVYNATQCEGLAQIATCPEGYTLIQDPVTGEDTCQLLYTTPPIVNQEVGYEYGIAIGEGTDSGFGSIGQSRFGRDMPIVIDNVAVDGMLSDQNDPSTWHYIVDNGTNTFWRNSLANNTDGIVNRLMRGNNAVNPGPFATVEFQINIPISKTVHLLAAADNEFQIEINTGGGYSTFVEPVDATIFNAVTDSVPPVGIWNSQAVAGGNFAWLSGDAANASQYSKAWIYKLDLPQGCTKFRMTADNAGTPGFTSPAGFAAAVIDVDDWSAIQNVSSWEQLPKIWDSETFDFIEPGTLERFRCEDGYQQFTDGTDGGTQECPVCRRDKIIYTCECEVDATSGIPGVLFGLCPVDNNGNVGSSYCQYEGYQDVTMEDQTFPIEVQNESYLKDICRAPAS